MTGFGRSELKETDYDIEVNLKTVNSKYLDINLRLPPPLMRFDLDLRKLLKEKLSRGKVEAFIKVTEVGDSSKKLSLNRELAKAYLEAGEQIKELGEGITGSVDLTQLLLIPEILTVEEEIDEERLSGLLEKTFSNALDQLVEERKKEGKNLKKDIEARRDTIDEIITQIEELAPTEFEASKNKLETRIKESLKEIPFDEYRFLNEVAYLSDKRDINEELTRLKSHIKRLNQLIETDEPVGRKLDFLAQELNREINTIGSKTDSTKILKLVVDLKSELEKIREQVQNIE